MRSCQNFKTNAKTKIDQKDTTRLEYFIILITSSTVSACTIVCVIRNCHRLGHVFHIKRDIHLTLPFPRVINFKFPLQTHQKYYIAQYEELGFP